MTMVSYGWLIAVAIISGCAGFMVAAFMIAAKEDDRYRNYPSSVYLHNALRFIEQGKHDVAYSEICYAITSAGDELSENETTRWKKIGG